MTEYPFAGFLVEQKLWLVRKLLSERIKESGFFSRMFMNVDSINDTVLMGVPEATIVSIAEKYLVLKSMGITDADAISEIEAARSQGIRGEKSFPSNISEFVKYRVRLEHHKGKQITDRDIERALDIAIGFGKRVAEELGRKIFGQATNYDQDRRLMFQAELPHHTRSKPISTYRSGDLKLYYFEHPETTGSVESGLKSAYRYPQVVVVADDKQPLLIIRTEQGEHGSFLCVLDHLGRRKNIGKITLLSKDEFLKRVGDLILEMKGA